MSSQKKVNRPVIALDIPRTNPLRADAFTKIPEDVWFKGATELVGSLLSFPDNDRCETATP